MKWPLGNCGATCLRGVTDTVQTVQYTDSQCTVYVYTVYTAAPETGPKIFTTTKPITFVTFDLSSCIQLLLAFIPINEFSRMIKW